MRAWCSIQREYFKEQEKAGKLAMKPPTPPKAKLSLKDKYGLPAHLEPILKDPESAMALTFSRQLWGNAVPGTLPAHHAIQRSPCGAGQKPCNAKRSCLGWQRARSSNKTLE